MASGLRDPEGSVVAIRAAAAESLAVFQRRVGADLRTDRLTTSEWVPRAVPKNRGAVRLSYALFGCYRDIKGIVAEPAGFDLRRFGLDPAPFLNRRALDLPAVTLVRRVLSGYLRDQGDARDALLLHIAQVQRDKLLGPATPGRLAFIKDATGHALHALSPEETARNLLVLRRSLLDLLGRQAARLERNGRTAGAVGAMIDRVRAETAPTAPAGMDFANGLADYPELAETIKTMYLGNGRLLRPGAPPLDDITHFCHVYADEIATLLDRHRQGLGSGEGITVTFAPRDDTFATLGDRFGDCSARRPKSQLDIDVANIHWTTYSWVLAPFYRVLLVTCDGMPAIKGHVLPLLMSDRPVLALDAIEVVPPLRDEIGGQPNPFRSERLLDLRFILIDALFEAVRDLGRRTGAEAIIVDKFSNCSWVRSAVSGLPSEAYHVRNVTLPFETEPIRSLVRELIGGGHDDHDIVLEVQARNLALMDQGLKVGWKEVGLLEGAIDGDDLPVRGP